MRRTSLVPLLALPILVGVLLATGCGLLLGDLDVTLATVANVDGGLESSACDDTADCAGACGQMKTHCGVIRDCGGCNIGLACGGGGTPNVCGAGSCTPSCTGKPCGASDGCAGVCTQGQCTQGQRCVAGTCACDPSSCAGCCSGNMCMSGTDESACGRGGADCAVCPRDIACGTASCGTCGGNGQRCCDGDACSAPLSCGGGGQSGVCGCAPNCAGQACGASDGCGGVCSAGSCPTGQHCASDVCICDTTSCTGCCSAGQCAAGTTVTACGWGGRACIACTNGQTCGTGTCNGGTVTGVTAIAAGGLHTCALKNGGVKCWGANADGELGNNSRAESHVPVDVAGLSSGMTSIAAGGSHTCALTSGGGVKCWGLNSFGQLGNNSTTTSSSPVAVSGLSSGVVAIATAEHHTCALMNGGAIKCWGINADGELGDNSQTESHVPVDVSGLSSGATALVAGYDHACAVTNGGAKCWGANDDGQLGNDSTTSSHVPIAVVGLSSGVAAISAGVGSTCALVNGGAVKCWGYNGFGELGNNSTTRSRIPVDVFGLSSGVTAIAAGGLHACALMNGGGVKCWGNNAEGELGNNSTTESHVAVDTSGLSSSVSAIAAGGSHTCVLTNGGGVKCWGANSAGQLGSNSTANSPVPLDVTGL